MRLVVPDRTPDAEIATQTPAAGELRWQFSVFELNEATRELFRDGVLLHLEPKPLNLLMYLLRRPGELVTKDELIEAVWSGRVVTDNVVARCVTKLREVFGEEGQALVKTVHGYGYRFTEQAVRVCDDAPEAVPLPQFRPGDSPPGRPEWVLVEHLASAGEVWLGRHRSSGAQSVFKFATDGRGLTSLKREISIYRLISGALQAPLPVVDILDWNLDEAPSFIEIEHHPLGSLRDWVEGRGGLALMPMSERLALIAEIAVEVAAIHSIGVLHKDLKPANVLVSGIGQQRARLLLCDFGSGRVDIERLGALELSRLGFSQSQLGERETLGTLLYTAPEVLSGQLPTVKADLYALGVMLFQFVVGDLRRPLAPGWERDVSDELLREDIARAADIQPEHRLADAAELAQRLRTLQERRDRVEARSREAAARQRTLEQAERDRLALERARARRAWMYALVATLVLGIAVSFWLYLREREAERRASTAAGTAYAINAFLNDDVLSAADPYLSGGGRNVTVNSILSRAAGRLGALKDRPTVHAQLSLTIGQAYANLGLTDEARDVYTQALDNARGRLSPQSGEMQSLFRRLAWLALEDGRYPEAHRLFDELYESAQVLPDPWRPEALLRARYGLARLDYDTGNFVRAVEGYDAILADLREQGVDNPRFQREVEWDLAQSLYETHDWARADTLTRNVDAYFSESLGAESPGLYWIRVGYGLSLLVRERFGEARELFEAVLAQSTQTLGERHPVSMACTEALGTIRLRQGDAAEALPYFQTVLDWRMRYRGPQHYLTREAMLRKAEALYGLNRYSDAEELLTRARELSVAQLGEEHPASLSISRVLAETRAALGNTVQAQAMFDRVLALGSRRMPANNLRLAWTHFGLGRLYRAQGREVRAAVQFEQAYLAFEAAFGSQDSRTLEAQRLLRNPSAAPSPRLF